ncbi:MAG: FlgD immunoglobulin-like domain containing protein, partial [Bacteroidota bacterium]
GSVWVGGIGSIPGGLSTSPFFAYGATGYSSTDSLRAGKGYWVKVSGAGGLILRRGGVEEGRIVMTAGGEMPPGPPVEKPMEAVPEEYGLMQNYPNPFNPVTVIGYGLPEASHVTIRVYDMLGRHVATLAEGYEEAGYRSVEWDGRNLQGERVGCGVYVYRMEAQAEGVGGSPFVSGRKMILLK